MLVMRTELLRESSGTNGVDEGMVKVTHGGGEFWQRGVQKKFTGSDTVQYSTVQ